MNCGVSCGHFAMGHIGSVVSSVPFIRRVAGLVLFAMSCCRCAIMFFMYYLWLLDSLVVKPWQVTKRK